MFFAVNRIQGKGLPVLIVVWYWCFGPERLTPVGAKDEIEGNAAQSSGLRALPVSHQRLGGARCPA